MYLCRKLNMEQIYFGINQLGAYKLYENNSLSVRIIAAMAFYQTCYHIIDLIFARGT